VTNRIVITLVAIMLSACAQLGIGQADTFAKKQLGAYTTVKTIAQSTLALEKSGVLSKDEAANIKNQNRAALTAIDMAGQIAETNIKDANTRLTSAITILTALQAFLATKGAPQSTAQRQCSKSH